MVLEEGLLPEQEERAGHGPQPEGPDAPPAEERPNQQAADDVDRQGPPGLRITSGADPMSGGEGIDAQCQDMEAPPPGVANARAQPGADADGDAQV